MIEMLEIICLIIVIDFFIVSLAKAFEKFNRLKAKHKQYVKEFVELVNDKDAIDSKSTEDLNKAER